VKTPGFFMRGQSHPVPLLTAVGGRPGPPGLGY
jgi:hypothetical protein